MGNDIFLLRERFGQDTFHFLVRFLTFLGLQEAETRKFELQAPAGGEQFNLPRFTASSRPRKVKNRGQKGHKSHENDSRQTRRMLSWLNGVGAEHAHVSLFNSQVFLQFSRICIKIVLKTYLKAIW